MGDLNSYFIIPLIAKDMVFGMTDKDAGELLKALFLYVESGTTDYVKDPVVRMAFQLCKTSIDKVRENYIAKCEQNRANALSKGKNTTSNDGERPQATASDGKRPQAMASDGERPQAMASDRQQNKYNNNINKNYSSITEISSRSCELSDEISRPPAVRKGLSITEDDFNVVRDIWNTNKGLLPKIRSVGGITQDGTNRKGKVIASMQFLNELTENGTKQEAFDLLAKLIKCASESQYKFNFSLDFDSVMREKTLIQLYDLCYDKGILSDR